MNVNTSFRVSSLFILLALFCNPTSVSANDWIEARFSGVRTITGEGFGRTNLESPVFIRDYEGYGGEFHFSLRGNTDPSQRQAAIMDTVIMDNVSASRYGAAIGHARIDNTENMEVFMSNVYLEPNWPAWVGYDETNYDGYMNNNAGALYAENLTIRGWNADAAIDNKANTSQFVNLFIDGPGNRPLRFWRRGPHYLVDATIEKEGDGTLIWLSNCDTEFRIYNSTFSGEDTVPINRISCDEGSKSQLQFQYLTVDPRTTGEMHPMFDNSYSSEPYEPSRIADDDQQYRCRPNFTPGTVIPRPYSAPYNFFLDERPLLLDVSDENCASEEVLVSAGRNNDTTAVYRYGYVWNGSSWQQFTWNAGNETELQADWLIGGIGSASVPLTDDFTYIVGYVCHRKEENWLCGCKDIFCSQSGWQLQRIERY